MAEGHLRVKVEAQLKNVNILRDWLVSQPQDRYLSRPSSAYQPDESVCVKLVCMYVIIYDLKWGLHGTIKKLWLESESLLRFRLTTSLYNLNYL